MKSILILGACLLNLEVFAQFEVGHRTITYNDPARSNRAIECEVYYPATSAGDNAPFANGPFPLVVVGHGFSMSVSAYQNWWEAFVPQGYIFALPTTEGGLFTVSHADFGLDLAFVADKIRAADQDLSSPFYGNVRSRTAILGHSMGGGATILAAANNPNIDCIVGLAPAETDPSAAAAAANVSAPALILHGNEDQVTPEADHALPIYNGLASSCKHYVRITEGAHCFFANYNIFCATGEMNIGNLTREEQQQLSYTLVGPWFDYFLNDNCSAYDDLLTELSTNTDLGINLSECTNDPPLIVDNGGTLQSDPQSNYQWYLNGNAIPGAAQQTYDYTLAGAYQVGTVNIGNCPVLSNEITVGITSIDEPAWLITSAPGHIELRSRSDLHHIRLEWFDMTGRILKAHSLGQVPANGSMILNTPRNMGMKLLRLTSDESVRTWKVW